MLGSPFFGGYRMDVRITVETVFENGETRKHELGIWSRSSRQTSGEATGLSLEDGKSILARMQIVIVQDQLEEVAGTCRKCPGCYQVRRIHGYRTRKLDTMFGRLDVRAPRIKLWAGQADAAGGIGIPLSPLSCFLPRSTTPEFQRLQAD